MLYKAQTAKAAWRDIIARARMGESLGFIDALAIAYKAGKISRHTVLRLLQEREIGKEELRQWKKLRMGLLTSER